MAKSFWLGAGSGALMTAAIAAGLGGAFEPDGPKAAGSGNASEAALAQLREELASTTRELARVQEMLTLERAAARTPGDSRTVQVEPAPEGPDSSLEPRRGIL